MVGYYIHLPFCESRCSYCDFISFTGCEGEMAAYTEAVCREIAGYPPQKVDSIFLGGGTPSLFSSAQLGEILSAVARYNCVAADCEITMEANPDTLDERKARELAALGVNRLSLGLQSGEDFLLKRLHRRHNRAGFLAAYEGARKAGFTNINVDVMVGLPGQRARTFQNTLDLLERLSPQHISAYELHVAEGTPLHSQLKHGEIQLPVEEELEEMSARLNGLSGYRRYEISNYAKPGYACRHNLHYWYNQPYVGAGCAAHGCLWQEGKVYRYRNTENLAGYISDPLRVAEKREIPLLEQQFETVMVGLRLVKGICLSAYEKRFHTDLLKRARGYQKSHPDLLVIEGGRLKLTPRGLDLQNMVLVDLMDLFLPEKEPLHPKKL